MYHSPTTVVFLRKNTFKGCGEEEEEKLTFYLLTIAIMQVNKLQGKWFRSAWALNASRYILFAHANDNKCIMYKPCLEREETEETEKRRRRSCEEKTFSAKCNWMERKLITFNSLLTLLSKCTHLHDIMDKPYYHSFIHIVQIRVFLLANFHSKFVAGN